MRGMLYAVPFAAYTTCPCPPHSSGWLLTALLLFIAASVAMLSYPGPWCRWLLLDSELTDSGADSRHSTVVSATNVFDTSPVHYKFRLTLLMLAAIHLLSALLLEVGVGKLKMLSRIYVMTSVWKCHVMLTRYHYFCCTCFSILFFFKYGSAAYQGLVCCRPWCVGCDVTASL